MVNALTDMIVDSGGQETNCTAQAAIQPLPKERAKDCYTAYSTKAEELKVPRSIGWIRFLTHLWALELEAIYKNGLDGGATSSLHLTDEFCHKVKMGTMGGPRSLAMNSSIGTIVPACLPTCATRPISA